MEKGLKIGDQAPDFFMPAVGGSEEVSLAALVGKNVVLYFYPKDNTPGCTIEANDFRDNIAAFTAANTVIIGVSKDSLKSHQNFQQKFSLPFLLASDEGGSVCEKYGIWKEKTNYGKKYMGIERSSFLIDRAGKIRKIWHKVKVEGHVAEVLAAAKSLT